MIVRVLAGQIGRRLTKIVSAPVVAIFAVMLSAGTAFGTEPQTSYVELDRPGDFVSQTNPVQCVGASMQMMLNMIRPGQDRTARTQLALQRLARASGPAPMWAGGREFTRPRRGASSFGWAAGLSRRGGGPYRVETALTRGGALRRAAEAIEATRRPVGLLVWHGAHAWVMSGFRATRRPNGEIGRISSITVLDPWYPRYSGTYGPSPRPGTRLTPRQLAADYLPWHRWFRSPFDGRFVLVLPYDPLPQAQLAAEPATASHVVPDWSRLPAPRLKPRPI